VGLVPIGHKVEANGQINGDGGQEAAADENFVLERGVQRYPTSLCDGRVVVASLAVDVMRNDFVPGGHSGSILMCGLRVRGGDGTET
jgi:hypothetical protein